MTVVRWLGVTPRTRRRVGAVVRLIAALSLVGGVYTAFAPGVAAEDTPKELSAAAKAGKRLYDNSCISCHGANGQGVTDRGPSLVGVGAAAVEFQVGTGRMPMAAQGAQAERKPPMFNEEQTRQIAAYIQELGGGPTVPEGDLADGDVANGGQLYRVNCASCHGLGAGGGALSSGKYAPSLDPSTDHDIYAAMLSGPQNMPVFGDNQLSPQEKKDVIAYIQYLKADQDPGGWGLGRFGPATEAIVIFLFGMVGLVFAMLWIAGKS
ncbi:MAG: cytochrome bc1 complex diheme cytochrome c subunit [Micromonosporaceae bacterium]